MNNSWNRSRIGFLLASAVLLLALGGGINMALLMQEERKQRALAEALRLERFDKIRKETQAELQQYLDGCEAWLLKYLKDEDDLIQRARKLADAETATSSGVVRVTDSITDVRDPSLSIPEGSSVSLPALVIGHFSKQETGVSSNSNGEIYITCVIGEVLPTQKAKAESSNVVFDLQSAVRNRYGMHSRQDKSKKGPWEVEWSPWLGGARIGIPYLVLGVKEGRPVVDETILTEENRGSYHLEGKFGRTPSRFLLTLNQPCSEPRTRFSWESGKIARTWSPTYTRAKTVIFLDNVTTRKSGGYGVAGVELQPAFSTTALMKVVCMEKNRVVYADPVTAHPPSIKSTIASGTGNLSDNVIRWLHENAKAETNKP